jgi:hypothetical protein
MTGHRFPNLARIGAEAGLDAETLEAAFRRATECLAETDDANATIAVPAPGTNDDVRVDPDRC